LVAIAEFLQTGLASTPTKRSQGLLARGRRRASGLVDAEDDAATEEQVEEKPQKLN
jgi:hypothetical protein